MIAIPAVDLREGACVQLVGGDYDAERVRLTDPIAVARAWVAQGFRRLHVVDLDAATGRGSNAAIVRELLATASVPVSVGGGVRTDEAIANLLAAGADTVVVGTRAVEDPEWLRAAARRHPGRLQVAADVRGTRVVTRGWTDEGDDGVHALLASLAGLPLAGVLVTAVHREGRLQGPDVPLVRSLTAATSLPIVASGGIASVADLTSLQDAGAAGAVLGMALYTGALDAGTVAREFPR